MTAFGHPLSGWENFTPFVTRKAPQNFPKCGDFCLKPRIRGKLSTGEGQFGMLNLTSAQEWKEAVPEQTTLTKYQ